MFYNVFEQTETNRNKPHMRYTLLIIGFILYGGFAAFGQSIYAAGQHFESGNYRAAFEIYNKLYQNDSLDINIAYRLGVCYLHFETRRERAIPLLEFAAKREKPITDEIHYYLGMAYFYAEKFDIAIANFDKYSRQLRPKFNREAKNFIRYCRNAKILIKQAVEVKFINVGDKINSKYPEYTPYITQDDEMLVFASKREYGFTEVYISTKSWLRDDSWTKGRPLTNRIKASYDAYVAGIAPDGSYLLIHYADFSPLKDVDISKKNEQRNRFDELLNLGKPINTTEWSEQGACLSKLGDTLFFASDKPGGYGGFDIYYCLKLPNGKWGLPRNLGPIINTEYDENYPNYTDSLIFCSTGHTSMGGYDLFVSKLNHENNQWDEPKNMGYPINDTYDNKTLSMLNDRFGYVSTYRNDSYGSLDIYKLVIENREQPRLVYRGKVYVNTNNKKIPVTDYDKDININVYNSDTGSLYGRYSIKKHSSTYVISLIPGNYLLRIESLAYQPLEQDITVPNTVPPEGENVIEKNLIVKLKDNK